MADVQGNMKCPYCKSEKGNRVVETRKCADAVMRRRVCFKCHMTFLTTETCDGTESVDHCVVES